MRSQTATAKHLIRIIQQGGEAAKQVIETLGKGSMSVMKQLFDSTKDGQSMEDAVSLVKLRMAGLAKDTLETMYTSASKTAEYQARSSKAYLEVLTKTASQGERDLIRTMQLGGRHGHQIAKVLASKGGLLTSTSVLELINNEKDPKVVLDKLRFWAEPLSGEQHKLLSAWVERAKEDTGSDFVLNFKGLIPETGAINILLGSLTSPSVNLYDITQEFIADVFAAPMPGAGPSINDLFTGLMSSMSNDLSNIVREAYRTGNTTDEISKAIRDLVDEKGESSVRRKANALARTAIAKVANATRLKTFEFNSDIVDRVMFVATLDHRTSKICMLTDGTVWWNKQYEAAAFAKPKGIAELRTEATELRDKIKYLRSEVAKDPDNVDLRRELNVANRELRYVEKFISDIKEEASFKPTKKVEPAIKRKSIQELYSESDKKVKNILKLNKSLAKHKPGTLEYIVIDRELRAAEDEHGAISEEIRKREKVEWEASQKIVARINAENEAAEKAREEYIKAKHIAVSKRVHGFKEEEYYSFVQKSIDRLHEESKGNTNAGFPTEKLEILDLKSDAVRLNLTGNSNTISIPSYHHRTFENRTMVHTHPSTGNTRDTSLSWSDIDSMYGLRQSMAIAVTDTGTIFEATPTLNDYSRREIRPIYKELRRRTLDAVEYAIEEDYFPEEYATDAYGHILNSVLDVEGIIQYRVSNPSPRFIEILDAIKSANIQVNAW